MPLTRTFGNIEGKAYALGGCSCRFGENNCVKTISIFVPYAMDGDGVCLQGDAFTQGIWPLDERVGVAEWQILSVPIMGCPPLAAFCGNERGVTMLMIIAESTITACHLMSVV
jgi:hypothetical protein